ncbi:MAG TPA: helix-turn-helix domain-containing protein [Paraburkholderia sp.]|jgi:transcriptional regulator GlxA family with amidase domain
MDFVEFTSAPASAAVRTRVALHVIGIVVFDQFSLLQAAEVADVFDKANQLHSSAADGMPRYKTVFLSATGEHVYSSMRVAVLTQKLPDRPALRALFVAGGDTSRAAHDPQLTSWLRDASTAVETLCAIGNGNALLDAAQARPAQFANHAVQTALEVIRRDWGDKAAQQIATLLSWASLPKPISVAFDNHAPVNQKIRASAQWIARNCDKRISITTAAETAGMSERSFLRHFRAEMGVKPSEHLRRVRVELASTLLAESDLPVDKIARRCGLTSGECLARLFRQVAHVSPSEYRSLHRAASA